MPEAMSYTISSERLRLTLTPTGSITSIVFETYGELVAPVVELVPSGCLVDHLASTPFPTRWGNVVADVGSNGHEFRSTYHWHANPDITVEKRLSLDAREPILDVVTTLRNKGKESSVVHPWTFSRLQIGHAMRVYIPLEDEVQELHYGDYKTPTGYNFASIPNEPWIAWRLPDRRLAVHAAFGGQAELNSFYTGDGKTIVTGRHTPIVEWHYAPIRLDFGAEVQLISRFRFGPDIGREELIRSARLLSLELPSLESRSEAKAGQSYGTRVVGTSVQPKAKYWAVPREPITWLRPSTKTTQGAVCWVAHSLEKIGPYDRVESKDDKIPEVALDAARGEAESFQIVIEHQEGPVGSLPLRILPWRAIADTGAGARPNDEPPHIIVEAFRVGYVHAKRPSDVVKGRVGWFPDPLFPIECSDSGSGIVGEIVPQPASGPNDARTILWITVHVPIDVQPGVYGTEVNVGGAQIPIRLRVRQFALPRIPTLRTAFGMWERFLERQYGLRPGDPEWDVHIEEARRLLLKRRISFVGMTELQQPNWEQALPKLREYFEAGLTGINIPSPYIPRVDGTVVQPDEATLERHKGIYEWLRAAGYLSRAYTYIADEPSERAYGAINQAVRSLRQVSPDLKVLLTINPRAEFFDTIDIFSPVFDSLNQAEMQKARELGKEIWWYPCVGPKHPYPNLFIDYENLDWRIMFWMTFHLGIEGLLYWTTTYWEYDVWADAESFPGGNGDGLLLYPGQHGPLPSVRLEVIRDGMEDYEYLALARDLSENKQLSEALKRQIHGIFQRVQCLSPMIYESSVGYWLDRRRELSDWLERAWEELDIR